MVATAAALDSERGGDEDYEPQYDGGEEAQDAYEEYDEYDDAYPGLGHNCGEGEVDGTSDESEDSHDVRNDGGAVDSRPQEPQCAVPYDHPALVEARRAGRSTERLVGELLERMITVMRTWEGEARVSRVMAIHALTQEALAQPPKHGRKRGRE